MIKKLKLPSSLNAKMLYVCVGGLLLALAVFLLINRLGMLLVDKVYMSDDAVKQRKNEIYSDFSAYVKANSVSGRDSLSVAKWTDGQPFVTVVIFGRGADHRRFHNGKTEQETEYAAAMTIITTVRSTSSVLRMGFIRSRSPTLPIRGSAA